MRRALLILACLLAASAVSAAESEPAVTEGGDVRLIVEDGAPAGDTLRGALIIALKPGWKTYWRDPGDAGIPPTIEASGAGVRGAEIKFPAPRRFDDGTSVWAGYDRPVALPVLFALDKGAAPATIEAHVFLGICEDICIPVDARLTIERPVSGEAGEPVVAAAFAALPRLASPSEGVSGVHVDGTSVTVDLAAAPADPDAALFVAAPPGWSFSAPKPVAGGDGARFVFSISFRPKTAASGPVTVPYTLADGDTSIEGTFTLP